MVSRITLFSALFGLCLAPQFAGAQHTHLGCGTGAHEQEQIKERMLENRRNRENLMADYEAFMATRSVNDSTMWVPTVFHMCAQSNGTGQHTDAWVLEQLCYFNENYADQNIQFYLVNINRFNSDQMYVNEAGVSDYIRSIHRVTGAMNIFVGGPTTPNTTYGAYYAPNYDWIFTWNDIYHWGLSHEVGHLFTLPHTFNGWEGMDYATESAATGKAPQMGSNGRPVEKVARGTAGENCQYAADGFCDTDPDYSSAGGGCTDTHNWRDPDSVAFSVSTATRQNYMSYFFCTNASSPSGKVFTNDQKEAIRLDNISRGHHLIDAPTPLMADGAPTIVWPENGSLAPYASQPIHFTWNNAPAAGAYLFKLERTINNCGIVVGTIEEKVVFGTETWVTLPANQEFRWTVEALSRYDVCRTDASHVSASSCFRTANWALSTDLSTDIQGSRVYPNPVGKDKQLVVEVEVPFSGEAQLSITNMLGQVVMPNQRMVLSSGKNVESINVRELAAGMYFVNIDNGDKRITHKVLVQE